MKLFSSLFCILGISFAVSAAPLKVLTSTTDLAALVTEIGGKDTIVTALLRGTENPHYVDSIPEYIRLVAESDAFFSIGLDLEVGWVPKIVARSGKASVQPGGKGYSEVGPTIEVLEKPTGTIDRSMGDVHGSGNPHFWSSPLRMIQAIPEIVRVLSRLDPTHSVDYAKRGELCKAQLTRFFKETKAALALVLKNAPAPQLIEYHKEFTYFINDYGLTTFGSVEEKPGVPPSAGRLAEVALASKQTPVKFLLAADFSPRKTLERFQEVSGLPVLKYPTSIQLKDGRSKGLEDYLAYEKTLLSEVTRLLGGAQPENHGKQPAPKSK